MYTIYYFFQQLILSVNEIREEEENSQSRALNGMELLDIPSHEPKNNIYMFGLILFKKMFSYSGENGGVAE